MKSRTPRVIGWIAKDAMNPAQAADAAIAKAREVCGKETCVLHMDTVTGRLTLFADPDMPIPPGTFVRGVAYNSDPDVLAACLQQRVDLGSSYRKLATKDDSPIRAAAYLELAEVYEAGANACREEQQRRQGEG